MNLGASDSTGTARPRIPSPQQRKMARIQCSFQVICRYNGREYPATVRDIGLEGMRLEIPMRVEPASVISLTYDSSLHCYTYDTIRVRVVWSHHKPFTEVAESGVAYLETSGVIEHSWVRHLLRVFDLDYRTSRERRDDIRVPSGLSGRVWRHDDVNQATLDGAVLDLGIGGALFESPLELPIGTTVAFEVGPMHDCTVLSCDAQVVRLRPAKAPGHWLCGLRFAGPRDTNYERLEPYVSRLLFGAEA